MIILKKRIHMLNNLKEYKHKITKIKIISVNKVNREKEFNLKLLSINLMMMKMINPNIIVK
jgi:hypothetical protein